MKNADIFNEPHKVRLDPDERVWAPDDPKAPGTFPKKTYINPGQAAAAAADQGERGSQAFSGGQAGANANWEDAAFPNSTPYDGVAVQAPVNPPSQ